MPRRSSIALALSLATGVATLPASGASPVLELERASKPDLVRARELDAAGVRAYREGRFREALLLFTEAYRLGGPSLELWNVARCHQRLDEGDDAAAVLTRYLEMTDLYPRDRAEAMRELHELRRRPSPLVVDVSASGASVTVNGKRVGTAPTVIELPPGRHQVRVELDTEVRDFELEARHGRPLVIRMSGESTTGPELGEPPSTSSGRRVEVDVQGGVYAHKLGGVFGRVGPGMTTAIRVGVGRERLAGFLGVRGEFYTTGWSSSSPNLSTECVLPDRYRGTAFAGLAGGGLTWDATDVVRTTIELGAGVEAFSAERGGGDVLEPSCSPSPGVVPLFAARTEVSFRIARAARMVLTPIAFAAHPAYDGAREAPKDATGAWLRMGASLGLSFDVGM